MPVQSADHSLLRDEMFVCSDGARPRARGHDSRRSSQNDRLVAELDQLDDADAVDGRALDRRNHSITIRQAGRMPIGAREGAVGQGEQVLAVPVLRSGSASRSN